MVKTTLWKTLFGKEADKLEHANDDERTYYVIEKEPLVNRFISVPKDKGSLNCAAFQPKCLRIGIKEQHSWSSLMNKSLLEIDKWIENKETNFLCHVFFLDRFILNSFMRNFDIFSRFDSNIGVITEQKTNLVEGFVECGF